MKKHCISSLTLTEFPRWRFCTCIAAVMTLLTLSGCLALPYVEFEKVALCKAEPGSAWKSTGTQLTLERDGVTYHFQADERRDLGSDAFWVLLSVDSNQPAVKVNGKFVLSGEKVPMIYDPKDAWIEVNGKRTAAVPTLWAPMHRATGLPRPGPVMPAPANVNRERSVLYGEVFIRFDIPPPQPGDKYRLGLGAIAIDGATMPLPVFDSCKTPARAGLDYVRC
jgi:hypothetical protein